MSCCALTSYAAFDHLYRRSGFGIEQTTRLLSRFADALLHDRRTAPSPVVDGRLPT